MRILYEDMQEGIRFQQNVGYLVKQAKGQFAPAKLSRAFLFVSEEFKQCDSPVLSYYTQFFKAVAANPSFRNVCQINRAAWGKLRGVVEVDDGHTMKEFEPLLTAII